MLNQRYVSCLCFLTSFFTSRWTSAMSTVRIIFTLPHLSQYRTVVYCNLPEIIIFTCDKLYLILFVWCLDHVSVSSFSHTIAIYVNIWSSQGACSGRLSSHGVISWPSTYSEVETTASQTTTQYENTTGCTASQPGGISTGSCMTTIHRYECCYNWLCKKK